MLSDEGADIACLISLLYNLRKIRLSENSIWTMKILCSDATTSRTDTARMSSDVFNGYHVSIILKRSLCLFAVAYIQREKRIHHHIASNSDEEKRTSEGENSKVKIGKSKRMIYILVV